MLTADLVGNLLIAQFFLAAATRVYIHHVPRAGHDIARLRVVAGPGDQGTPAGSIRGYWENGGRWPDDKAVESAARRDGADSRRHAA